MVRDREQLNDLADFARAQGLACFGNFSRETLLDYLAFHRLHRTLMVVQTSGRGAGARPSEDGTRIEGLGIAWQCFSGELFGAGLTLRHAFGWYPSHPRGDVLFVAEVVATGPGTLRRICQALAERFPAWRTLPVWTFRRKLLTRLEPGTLERLLGEHRTSNIERPTSNQKEGK